MFVGLLDRLKNVAKSLFIVYFLACSVCIFGDVVDEGIDKISLNDRICMKAFFDQAIKHNQAAHVICFNQKPVCITCCALRHKDKTFNDVLALRGWLAFKNNEHLFPHPNFIFNENIFESGRDCKILHIYVINKKSLVRCLDAHCLLFKEILGQGFSIDEFVTKLEEGYPLPSLLLNDEMLLGVLLGFGEKSAHAFKEVRKKCTETYAPPHTETYCRIDLKCPQGCQIAPVVFMGDPNSKEVQTLSSIYERELQVVWSAYKTSKHPLKMILERLCSEKIIEFTSFGE